MFSAVLPGAGHFLVGRWRKGLVLLAVFAIMFLAYRWLRLPQTIYGAVLPIWVRVGFCIYATWDAAYGGKQRPKPSQWWLAALLPTALVAGVVHGNWVLRASGFGVFSVPSQSMAPAIPLGSRVMVDRSYYRHATTRHGEIVVFTLPKSPGIYLLKRVIAVGGETIEVRGDSVLVNGTKIDEPYALFKGPVPTEIARVRPFTLPAGTIFVMGDNRHLSLDSRQPDFGPVDYSAIRGKVIYELDWFQGDVKRFD
jgi:signal peptidase I